MSDISPAASPDVVPSARALLKERDYLCFWTSRWTGSFAAQIQSVAMGWQMYALARLTHTVQESAFLVGMIGLAAFIPVFLLTLPAGETADRYDRKKVLLICLTGEIATVLTLAIASWKGWASVPMLLGVGFVFGASRAFFAPANTALGPMLVPRPLLPRAIAWNSLAWQTASIAGPAAGGLLVAISPAHAYFTTFGLYLIAGLAVFLIRKNAKPVINPGSRWALMKEGLAYVWRQKIVFGAISLDLFAVLLGGATALLPVFARDILHVGPQGFGVLRSGPAIGATVVALALAANPIRKHAGLFMFGGVATFGAATLVFAVSKQLWLSVAALAVLAIVGIQLTNYTQLNTGWRIVHNEQLTRDRMAKAPLARDKRIPIAPEARELSRSEVQAIWAAWKADRLDRYLRDNPAFVAAFARQWARERRR